MSSAAAAVRAAFEEGISRPLEWRRSQLKALDALLAEHGAQFEAALHRDLGRAPIETHVFEIAEVRAAIRSTLKNLEKWTAPQRVPVPLLLRPARAEIRREPLGAVLVISPWNYPVQLLFLPLVGALAAGNTAVLKPSEVAPATADAVARLVPRYLDERAVRVVLGGVPETTELLAQRWDHIFYTGNGQVARVIMRAAAEHLTPVTLELGGKSPVWVDPSADLTETARWLAWGKFLNAGQTCVAPDYVLTTPEVQGPLVEALRDAIAAFYGPDPRTSPDYSRIISERHLDRLAGLLDSGTLALGGQIDRADRYLAPTILRDVPLDSPVMAGEIFGPILPIVPVADVDEAVRVVRAGPHPLALYAFSGEEAPADRFVAGTASGSAAINAVLVQLGVPALPFGGVGESGMGAYHGEHSVRVFSHERAVLRTRPGPSLAAMVRPPHTRLKEWLLRGT